jgi:hypothetical protein
VLFSGVSFGQISKELRVAMVAMKEAQQLDDRRRWTRPQSWLATSPGRLPASMRRLQVWHRISPMTINIDVLFQWRYYLEAVNPEHRTKEDSQ